MSNNSPENRKARRLYKEYYDSQPPDIQAQLPLPEKEDDITGMDGNWVFPVNEPRVPHNPHHDSDAGEQTQQTRTYTEDEMQEVIRRVVMAMQLSESPEVLFQARCILIAFGIGDPPKESELARLKGCSRQFVSKKVKRIQQLFNLSPSQFMRSEQACKAYAKAYQKHKNQQGNSKYEKPTYPPSGVKESIFRHPPARGVIDTYTPRGGLYKKQKGGVNE